MDDENGETGEVLVERIESHPTPAVMSQVAPIESTLWEGIA